jgi:hypothetical protein
MSTLAHLQKWYSAQCNGDWEHSFGVSIDTLDNPGWSLSVNLEGTVLEDCQFQEVKSLQPESSWIHCWVKDKKFEGRGGPEQLEQIIELFLQWAARIQQRIQPDIKN